MSINRSAKTEDLLFPIVESNAVNCRFLLVESNTSVRVIVKNWDNIIHIVNLNNKNSFTNIILSLNNGVYDTRKTFKDMISKIY